MASPAISPSWGQPASFQSLQTLSLFGYNLVGSLPGQWGCATCFPSLQTLQLAGSLNLIGTLPLTWSSPGSFQSLKVLNLAAVSLAGSIPPDWVSTTAFPSLTYLSLANTTLTGAVPSFNNSQLAVLDLFFSALTGDISNLWSSKAIGLSAIGLTAVNLTGSFPPQLPTFWQSLKVLIVDKSSITDTIPTFWLDTVSATAEGTTIILSNQMQNISFSGAQIWGQSLEDPSWWQVICSSFSRTSGYASLVQPAFLVSQEYSGIEAVDGAILDVTTFAIGEPAQLPTNDTRVNRAGVSPLLNYYHHLINCRDDFALAGAHSPARLNLPSPVGQCHDPPWATIVIAAWATFGALLAASVVGYAMWQLVCKWYPAVLFWHPKAPEAMLKCMWLSGQFVPVLGLGLYVYDLVSDIQVLAAIWGLRFWWGKAVLAIIVMQCGVRAVTLTCNLSWGEGKSCLQIGLRLLCLPLVIATMPLIDVLCTFGCLHKSCASVKPADYRHLRTLLVPVFQSLPNAIVITVIYYRGAAAFSPETSLLHALEYDQRPRFLTTYCLLTGCNFFICFHLVGYCWMVLPQSI